MEAPADRQTFHVWWELSCSGGTGGEENLLWQIRAFQAQTPQDLGEQIITTSTLGRTKEKGNQQVLQGHTCSINLIKSSPCRGSDCLHPVQLGLTRCILTLSSSTRKTKRAQPDSTNSPLVLPGNFPHTPPESNQSVLTEQFVPIICF